MYDNDDGDDDDDDGDDVDAGGGGGDEYDGVAAATAYGECETVDTGVTIGDIAAVICDGAAGATEYDGEVIDSDGGEWW